CTFRYIHFVNDLKCCSKWRVLNQLDGWLRMFGCPCYFAVGLFVHIFIPAISRIFIYAYLLDYLCSPFIRDRRGTLRGDCYMRVCGGHSPAGCNHGGCIPPSMILLGSEGKGRIS